MDYIIIIKGIIAGIAVSAPLGPIGVMCIQKTINKGFRSGLATGFGAIVADVFFAFVAGFGVTLIQNFLNEYQVIIRISGSIVLLIFGIKLFRSKPVSHSDSEKPKNRRYFADFLTTFFIAATNPITVLGFGVAFATLGVTAGNSDNIHVLILIASVFVGAVIWWLLLSGITWLFRKRIKPRSLIIINKVAGSVVLIFAIYIAISVFFLK